MDGGGGRQASMGMPAGSSLYALPGATFDSLLQEALSACERQLEAAKAAPKPDRDKVVPLRSEAVDSLPVVVSPDPEEHVAEA